MGLFNKIFGSYNDRELKKIYPIADAIEKLEPEYAALTDDALRAKTDEFKARYNDGETLDELLPEAFAAVREAAWRVLGRISSSVSPSARRCLNSSVFARSSSSDFAAYSSESASILSAIG